MTIWVAKILEPLPDGLNATVDLTVAATTLHDQLHLQAFLAHQGALLSSTSATSEQGPEEGTNFRGIVISCWKMCW